MRKITASQKVLAILCVMSFVLYVDRVNLSTAAGPIQKELGRGEKSEFDELKKNPKPSPFGVRR